MGLPLLTRSTRQLLAGSLLVSLWCPAALAVGRSNFDSFLQQRGSRPLPAAASAQAQARGLRILHTEPRVGVPTFVRADAPQPLAGVTMQVLTPDGAARAHLRGQASLYRLSGSDVSTAELKSVHRTGRGPVVVRYGQSLDGVEVFRGETSVVMNSRLELVALSGYLLPSDTPRRGTFRLGAPDVATRAFTDVTGETLGTGGFVEDGALPGGYVRLKPGSNASATSAHAVDAVRAKKVYYPTGDALEPAYYVELSAGKKDSADSEYMAYVVSAVDGRVLMRNSLTANDSFQYRVFAEKEGASESALLPFKGPQGWAGTPHPTGTPDGFQAPFVAPNLQKLQNYPFSRNDAWLPPGATQTRGNNVDAYADIMAPDGFQAGSDLRAVTTSPGVFDYTYDTSKSPDSSQTQRMAAVTNLFYVNNFLHDWFYDAGFDEAAGNAQASNYGRGGLENDSILAEAQDYSGRNNANMSTPADGGRPRMQMYVFDGYPELTVRAPSSLAGGLPTDSADFGKQSFTFEGSVKLLSTDAGQPVQGCDTFASGTFSGKVALVDRGGCAFTNKALNAQAAGASAVIIANNAPGGGAMAMSGSDPFITVPVLSVSYEVAQAWKQAVAANASTDIQVRMRRTPDLDRDGTVDNAIVAHEWGHYLSNRLIGNGNGLINSQGHAMGEGWSDVVALLLLTRESDRALPGNAQYQGVYNVAGYALSGGANDAYYFGIRRVPYSTDFTKNALTFKHIQAGQTLPTSHPVNGSRDGSMNAEAHYTGEVWATMLWDCYVSLLNAHPFAEAQERMKQYLVASYKATPVAPTILEARDALLSVVAASDAQDYQRFLQAFARRGAGMGAKGPDRDSGDHVGVVESYEAGNNLEVVSIQLDDSTSGCDKDGVLDAGESGLLTVTVRNTGVGSLAPFRGTVSSSSGTATFTFGTGGALGFPALAPGETASASLPVTLEAVNVLPPATAATTGFSIAFDEPSLPTSAATATYDARVDYDDLAGVSAKDDMDSALSMWTSTVHGGTAAWRREAVGSRTVYHAVDLPEISDEALTSPWMTVSATGNFEVVLTHRYSFESWYGGAPWFDGGAIELSTDGVTWYDVFKDLNAPPQTGLNYGTDYPIGAAGSDNPVTGHWGFVGISEGYPAFGVTRVGLGTKLAGQRVQVRFRVGSDSGVGAHGWDIDSVEFNGVVETPFSAQVAEASGGLRVCNQRPVAQVGADQEVSEFLPGTETRRTVQLSGLGSRDGDGQPLTYQWRQVAGPPVALSSTTDAQPTFVVDVPRDTVYAFELVVSDGIDFSAPKVTSVKVLNANRAPRAVVTAPKDVDERTVVTLDGSQSSDPDGDYIFYTWMQVTGGGKPVVKLSSTTANKTTFMAPDVKADTTLTFRMVVDDGQVYSEVQTVTVTVHSVDRAPVVDAGNAVSVKTREPVTLTGQASDPDGDALTLAWTQHADEPRVALTGANTPTLSFTAPDVDRETRLHFDLTVTASGVTATDTVEVTVLPVNRKPVAQGPSALAVTAGDAVTLQGGGADADGDTLTFAWRQVEGPAVTLLGADTATPNFTAPEVSSATRLAFELVVRDGTLQSDPVRAEVNVAPRVTAPPPPAATSPSGCSATGSGSPLMVLALLAFRPWLRRRRVGGNMP